MAKNTWVSASALAQHLNCSRRWIAKLVKAGVLPQRPDGNFDQDKSRLAYIKHLRDGNQRDTKSAAASRTQELRAQEIELRLAREKAKLIEFANVELVIEDIVSTFHSELIGVPASCTRDLALRNIIEEKLDVAIDRCRKHFEEASEALRAGREVFPADEEAAA